MNRRSFFTRLFAGNLLLVVIILAVGWIVASRQLDDRIGSQSEIYQRLMLHTVTDACESVWPMEQETIDLLCDTSSSELDYRLTVIDTSGKVLGDTDKDPDLMESHKTSSRPEVLAALKGQFGSDVRRSETLGIDFRYVASPIVIKDPLTGRSQIAGVVRIAQPLRSLEQQKAFLEVAIFWSFCLMALAAVLLALLLSWLWYRPLGAIIEAARRIAAGDLTQRPDVKGPLELCHLANALDRMRSTVSSQLDQIRSQREKLLTILAHLQEAILAVDASNRVVFMNKTARNLLFEHSSLGVRLNRTIAAQDGDAYDSTGNQVVDSDTNPDDDENDDDDDHPLQDQARINALSLGVAEDGDHDGDEVLSRDIQTVVRLPQIIKLFHQARLTGDNVCQPLDVDLHGRRYTLEVEIDPSLGESANDEISSIVVLRDLTAKKRTDQMKADFVANASHELRTPLATIRAAIDTLVDDPLDDPFTVRHIVNMLDRHVGRLEAMVSDLLDLYVVENENLPCKYEPYSLSRLGDWIKNQFAPVVEEKEVRLSVSPVPEDADFQIDRKRLMLIIQNLLDNAVKFTPAGGQVTVLLRHEQDWLVIRVEDTGCGIAPEDQVKVFERFYQSDHSRKGDNRIRGTGLGLAIVKHATERMDGKIQLVSRVDVGTTVEVQLRAPVLVKAG